MLRKRGDEVVATDLRRERLEQAESLGAALDGRPVDAAVVTAHGGIDDALHRLEPGGTLLVFAEPATASLEGVYRNELRIIGSRSASPASFAAAIELLPSLILPTVTTLPLERFAEGVERYRSGDVLKVVFTP